MRPLARLGYMEYATLTPESVFTLDRPMPSADGLSAEACPAPASWDGTYR
jgi:hypothetical protein